MMASTAPRIIVLGSVNVDLVVRGPCLPRPGETVLGGEFFQAAGGKGANQAVAAARAAREPVVLIAAVGDDDYGRQMLEGFRRENLLTSYIRTEPGQATGVALIMVDERGENLISVASGANRHLTGADVDAVPDEVFRSAAVFLTNLESPLATVERALRRAREAGLITILNPAPADAALGRGESASGDLGFGGLARWVDVLTPNEGEAALLAGRVALETVPAAADPAQDARRLRTLGFAKCVITLGPAGCLVVDEHDFITVPGQPVRAIDATAAGDAFNGALAVAVSEGRSLAEAARWANCAAAIAVTRRGAQPSLPTRAEIDAGEVRG
ncbi:MAG TPA: ribokinase [Pirellulales bacterium]|nr:ribokinase [Pirellulales bacterium]